MPFRTLIAAAALSAAMPAFAQQNTGPNEPPPSAPAETTADEPVTQTSSRDEVYITGARQIQVQPVEGARSYAQRQRDCAEGRCVLQAQEMRRRFY